MPTLFCTLRLRTGSFGFRHEIFAAGQEDDCRIRRVLPYIFKSRVSYAKFDGITFFHIQVFVIFDYLIVGRKHLLDKTVAWLLETCIQDKEAEYDTYEVVKQRGCFHGLGQILYLIRVHMAWMPSFHEIFFPSSIERGW